MDHRTNNLGYFNYRAAETHGDRMALLDLSHDPIAEITHAELNGRMNRVAAALSDQSLQVGDRILLAMGNRYEFIEAFFGCMRAGLIPIPLNIKLGSETIDFIIEDSDAKAAIIEPACNPNLVPIVDKRQVPIRIATAPAPPGWLDYEAFLMSADPDSFAPPEISSGQIAFLPYTSGSTGRPKGVLLSHEGMLWGIRTSQQYWPCQPDERTLVAGPLYHKNAMRVSIKPKLHVGASAVILPKFEPRQFLRALADHGCTDTGGVPAMYRMMLAEDDLLASLDFPRLHSLEMGSAVVGADLIKAVEDSFGAPVEEAYGLTEGGGPLRQPLDGRHVPRGSCGVVAPEVEVKLVDENGKEHPDFGELWVRSPAVLSGYNNRPELNRERLTDGWLHTNDLVRRDGDGFFYFMGRTDDQFSCGGENIQPKEVELLLVQHPAVIDAVVLPITHDVKGLAPAALVTLRTNADVDEQALKEFCLENGPAYAHPRRIFAIDALPVGGTGKVDRKAAKETIEAFMADGA
ncbi:MAG: acyl--CoA ligase [Rhodospirillaceae bacterium]|jgi:long-chain acyl-CoA synthetase|nr:acyl--CoA ligase [Rhodospirillaceae bacterium]MBT5455144.1 acyl--CoA ligase [Rhodospirillaceae bacterium]